MTAHLVDVSSAADPAIEPYARTREKDLRRAAEGLFVAEGEVVVRVLAQGGRFGVRSLLVDRRRVDALADVLAAVPDGVPAFVAPQSVMDAIVGFHIHRGVLALGERAADRVDVLSDSRLVVGAVSVTNHDNVGGIFRNAAAFGIDAVVLDEATCDPLYRKSIRVSVGGALVVPFARFANAETMLDALEGAGFTVYALTARGEETLDVLAREKTSRRALLVGTEGDGLPESVLRRARRVRIAMSGSLDSLNVAVATGIALHEATR